MRHTALLCLATAVVPILLAASPQPDRFAELDKQVRAFLERNRRTWIDLNVPAADGQVLHDLVLEHKYTRALEIGTSTGHSGIWIAWALAKTGGRLTTIEIDRAAARDGARELQGRRPVAIHRRQAWRRSRHRPGAPRSLRLRLLGRGQELVQELPRRRLAEARARRRVHGPQRHRADAGDRRVPRSPQDAARREHDDEPRKLGRDLDQLQAIQIGCRPTRAQATGLLLVKLT